MTKTPAPAAAADVAADASADAVQCLVLTQCCHGVAYDVVTVDAASAEQGVAAGILDTNPDAVAYALSLT